MLSLSQLNLSTLHKIAYHSLAIGGISLLTACGGSTDNNTNHKQDQVPEFFQDQGLHNVNI